MKGLSGFTMFCYTLVIIAIGLCLAAICFDFLPRSYVDYTMDYLYTPSDARMLIGGGGAALVLVSLLLFQFSSGRMRRERTIAFENPDGQVTVSLAAIEEFIRRIAIELPEVKELKPLVSASKRGVEIITRVTLVSNANLPETTEKIQGIIKAHIQEMLGIEETISVKVHINKISYKDKEKREKPQPVKQEEEKPVFRGIEYGTE
ncbi:MAG: alkaline shock response membrane anchor protein AmaP [Candidatus Omnitrophica bacterium]|nr:alkaline shock response membrane anchor protein AmaP [Candidatus Omnitrophota bacterium]